MQEDIDNYDMGPKWSSIVEHYWWKRFVANKISPMQRYRKAVMNDMKSKIECGNCHKIYSSDAIDLCWTCSSYICNSCGENILRKIYPNMRVPTSCTTCTYKCEKCENPFIKAYNEIHCFECQYNTGMFTVDWKDRSKFYGLPYGTRALKKLYITYLNSLDACKPKPEINPSIIIGRNAQANGNNTLDIIPPGL